MQITHKIADILFELFPKAKEFGNDLNVLMQEIKDYYTISVFQPIVKKTGDSVTIDINIKNIIDEKPEFDKALLLCEIGNYTEAVPILKSLIAKNPTVSEYHRIYVQILSDEGNLDKALNCIIDSLKWDPNNTAALIMMGNIFYRQFNDSITAKKYFDEALAQKPDDYTALTNYASLLLMSGDYHEAKKYFEHSYQVNNNYPNSAIGLAQVLFVTDQSTAAFEYAIHAIKACKKSDKIIYDAAISLAIKISQKVIESGAANNLIIEYQSKLEKAGGIPIQIVLDDTINTAAKMEFAENYNRDFHLLKHKSKSGLTHLIMHELVHLDFAIQAKAVNEQMLFTSNANNKNIFYKDLTKHREQLLKRGIKNDTINGFYDGVFAGINLQMFNTPIDLFIEDYLFNTYPDLKPIQFASLLNLLEDGKEAVTNKEVINISPVHILSTSKVLNLVTALHFKDLFGIDHVNEFNASKLELNLAAKLYEEYNEYRQDRHAGEEYELIQNWAEDLKLDKNFELVNEQEFRNKRTDIDNLLSNIENDPYDLESNDPAKKREMDQFQKSQQNIGTNMAVVMFMVEAIQFFENKQKEEIKNIALEIATLGTQGFNPKEDNYRISAIKNKTFSGYHILAYYYVSWALAIPEMLSQLQLPFNEEYKLALSIHKPNQL